MSLFSDDSLVMLMLMRHLQLTMVARCEVVQMDKGERTPNPFAHPALKSICKVICSPPSVLGVGLDDLKVEVVDDALHDVAGGDLGVADLCLVA